MVAEVSPAMRFGEGQAQDGALHPNEVDRKRIERALEKRRRYRYVTPQVCFIAGGYQIVSPCCSRNIDPEGGLIDIARLEFLGNCWRLSYKDHHADCWIEHGEYPGLPEVLKLLSEDPERKFWQ